MQQTIGAQQAKLCESNTPKRRFSTAYGNSTGKFRKAAYYATTSKRIKDENKDKNSLHTNGLYCPFNH